MGSGYLHGRVEHGITLRVGAPAQWHVVREVAARDNMDGHDIVEWVGDIRHEMPREQESGGRAICSEDRKPIVGGLEDEQTTRGSARVQIKFVKVYKMVEVRETMSLMAAGKRRKLWAAKVNRSVRLVEGLGERSKQKR